METVSPAANPEHLFARGRSRALTRAQGRERLVEQVASGGFLLGTALLLGDVVEADDAYTGSHSRGVVELSLAVIDRLGLSFAQRRNVEFAALLHDVGKISVPNEIINKEGPLDEAEWEVMQRSRGGGAAPLRRHPVRPRRRRGADRPGRVRSGLRHKVSVRWRTHPSFS